MNLEDVTMPRRIALEILVAATFAPGIISGCTNDSQEAARQRGQSDGDNEAQNEALRQAQTYLGQIKQFTESEEAQKILQRGEDGEKARAQLTGLHQKFVEAERQYGQEIPEKWQVYFLCEGRARENMNFTSLNGTAQAYFTAIVTGNLGVYRQIDPSLDERIREATQHRDETRAYEEVFIHYVEAKMRQAGQGTQEIEARKQTLTSEMEDRLRRCDDEISQLRTTPWHPHETTRNFILFDTRKGGQDDDIIVGYDPSQSSPSVLTLRRAGEDQWVIPYTPRDTVERRQEIVGDHMVSTGGIGFRQFDPFGWLGDPWPTQEEMALAENPIIIIRIGQLHEPRNNNPYIAQVEVGGTRMYVREGDTLEGVGVVRRIQPQGITLSGQRGDIELIYRRQ